MGCQLGAVPEKTPLVSQSSVHDHSWHPVALAGSLHLLRASKHLPSGREGDTGVNGTNGINTLGCHPGSAVFLLPSGA